MAKSSYDWQFLHSASKDDVLEVIEADLKSVHVCQAEQEWRIRVDDMESYCADWGHDLCTSD